MLAVRNLGLLLGLFASASRAQSNDMKGAIGKITRSPDLQNWCRWYNVEQIGGSATTTITSAYGTKTKDASTTVLTNTVTPSVSETSTLPTVTVVDTLTQSETVTTTQSDTLTVSMGTTQTQTVSTPTTTVVLSSVVTDTTTLLSASPTTTLLTTDTTLFTLTSSLSFSTPVTRAKRSIAARAAVFTATRTLNFKRAWHTAPPLAASLVRRKHIPDALSVYTDTVVLGACIHVVGLVQTSKAFVTGPSTTKVIYTATVSATTTSFAPTVTTTDFTTPTTSVQSTVTDTASETSTYIQTTSLFTTTDLVTNTVPDLVPTLTTTTLFTTGTATSYFTATTTSVIGETCWVDVLKGPTCLPVQTLQSQCLGDLSFGGNSPTVLTLGDPVPADVVFLPQQGAIYVPAFDQCLVAFQGIANTGDVQVKLEPCGTDINDFGWSLALNGIVTWSGPLGSPTGSTVFPIPPLVPVILTADPACPIGFNVF